MFEKLMRKWQRFKHASPGQRFQKQSSPRERSTRSPVQRVLFIGGGIVLVGAGIFFLFVPGPGLILILFGGFLLAQQSTSLARRFDSVEVWLRRSITWSLHTWRSSSAALKILLVFFAVALLAILGFGAIQALADATVLRLI